MLVKSELLIVYNVNTLSIIWLTNRFVYILSKGWNGFPEGNPVCLKD